MNKAQLIELVREYGRERYRCGKANIRSEIAPSNRGRHRNKDKAKFHAQKAVVMFKQITDAVEQSPYVDA